jgi:DedD protein
MAFFKFRKTGASQDTSHASGETAAPSETVENLRRRSLYQLIGAAVLVLIAIIGFPILFDTQPRPVAVQAPIIIPDRNAVPPLALPASIAATAPAQPPVLPTSSQVPASASLAAGEQIVNATNDKSISGAIVPAASSLTSAPQTAQDESVGARQQAARQEIARQQAAKRAAEQRKVDQARNDQAKRLRSQIVDAARARALLDGGSTAPPGAASTTLHIANAHVQEGRYAIQIGAFATEQAAQTARQKAERAGVKTYTQTIATGAGARTRVRVGPFASRDEAERALAKLKQAGLGGSILSP